MNKDNTVKTFVEQQGKRLSLEVWAVGVDDSNPESKQYKFGMQIYQIPMSGKLRFDAHFIHDLLGDSIDLEKINPIVSQMVQDHIEPFLSGRMPQDVVQKWLSDEVM